MSIEEAIARIRQNIATAAAAAGRDPAQICLCAATKMNDAAAVQRAIAAGVDCCGENRVQELRQKLAQDAYRGAPVHFIGHLQTNKVRQVVGVVDLIQSVDSLHLMTAIQREAQRQNLVQDILLEVNIARQPSKSGFFAEQIHQVLLRLPDFPALRVRGLMAIPPICQKTGGNVKFFQEMCALSVDIMAKKYDNVRMDVLSMGMSGDYVDAIACGSTMIRLGTAIFGARDYAQK